MSPMFKFLWEGLDDSSPFWGIFHGDLSCFAYESLAVELLKGQDLDKGTQVPSHKVLNP